MLLLVPAALPVPVVEELPALVAVAVPPMPPTPPRDVLDASSVAALDPSVAAGALWSPEADAVEESDPIDPPGESVVDPVAEAASVVDLADAGTPSELKGPALSVLRLVKAVEPSEYV